MVQFFIGTAVGLVLMGAFCIFAVRGDDEKHASALKRLEREVAQERRWKEHDRALAEDYKLTAESLQRQVNTLEREIQIKQHMLDMASPRRNYY